MKEKELHFKFDKFIKDIDKRETAHNKRIVDHQSDQEELPQRRYNRMYREHWQNSTRYRRKK